MIYALYKDDVFVRTQEFDGTPPVLAPEKGMAWREYVPPPPVEPTPEGIKDGIMFAIQMRLDNFARTRDYDGIMSACTYAGSAVPKYQVDGQYCLTARDATWFAAYTIMQDVLNGLRPMPTSYDEIEPELPVLAWPE